MVIGLTFLEKCAQVGCAHACACFSNVAHSSCQLGSLSLFGAPAILFYRFTTASHQLGLHHEVGLGFVLNGPRPRPLPELLDEPVRGLEAADGLGPKRELSHEDLVRRLLVRVHQRGHLGRRFFAQRLRDPREGRDTERRRRTEEAEKEEGEEDEWGTIQR